MHPVDNGIPVVDGGRVVVGDGVPVGDDECLVGEGVPACAGAAA